MDASDLQTLLTREAFSRVARRYLKLVASGEITHAEYVLLSFVADRTVSWRQLWRELSYDDLQRGTGLSRQKVADAVASLDALNLIARKRLGRGHAYALVPSGLTSEQVLTVADDVDNHVAAPESSVYSVDRSQSTDKTGSPILSSSIYKKTSKKAAGAAARRVDKGLSSRASSQCEECHGEGWIVLVEPDGFTESVARCPCTS